MRPVGTGFGIRPSAPRGRPQNGRTHKTALAVVIVLAACGVIVWVAFARAHRGHVGAHGGASLHVSGMVEATTVDVAPEIAGTITELVVDEGDAVRRGQLIARLDAAIWQARFAAAQAQAQQAAQRVLEAETAVAVASGTSAAGIAQAQAAHAAAADNLAKLGRGSRPQEIATAERRVGEAQAVAQAARAQLDKLQAGLRPQEVEEARARAARAQSEAEQASRDWQRMRALAEQGAVSSQAAEAARTAAESARAQAEVAQQQLSLAEQGARREDVSAAQAQLRGATAAAAAARAQLSLVREGPRREDISAAQAQVRGATAAVAAARAQAGQVEALRRQAAAARAQQRAAEAAAREARIALDKTKLYAPFAGVVQTKIAEAGDTVSPGAPVVRLVNPDDVWLTVYVPETAIGRVRVGLPVRVTLDSYPGRDFPGAVKSISSEAEFTPKYVQTPDERTRLVYAVKVRLNNRERIFKPGMPADAVVTLRGDGGAP